MGEKMIGPALPQGGVLRVLYVLMAMTLAYMAMTLTVSKCCYRSVCIKHKQRMRKEENDAVVVDAGGGQTYNNTVAGRFQFSF